MVITLFWSRFREDLGAEGLADYQENAERMLALAQRYPGFVSLKTYTAEDGARLSVVVFESEEQQAEWRGDPQHLEVQQRGRDRYYEEYRLMACAAVREYGWRREAPPGSVERGNEAAGD